MDNRRSMMLRLGQLSIGRFSGIGLPLYDPYANLLRPGAPPPEEDREIDYFCSLSATDSKIMGNDITRIANF